MEEKQNKNNYQIYELGVLGCLLKQPSLLHQIKINTNIFNNKNIKTLIQKINNGVTDYVTLFAEASTEGKAILKKCQSICDTQKIDEYIKKLTDFYYDDGLKKRVKAIIDEDDFFIKYENLLNDMKIEKEKYTHKDMSADDYINLKQIQSNKNIIPTGFKLLDKMLSGGFKLGSLSYCGAAPSTGKTAFSLNIAQNVLSQGKKVMVISYEMTFEQLIDRLISSSENIEYNKFNTNKFTKIEFDKIKKSANLFIDDTKSNLIILNNILLENIETEVKQYKPQLLVIDFIQNVVTQKDFQITKAKMDYISSTLKRLALNYNLHCMVLSQISRFGEKSDKVPTMSDLKESGNLEADGDYICLLYRPYITNKSCRKISKSETKLLLDKNKYGECGTVDLSFDFIHQKFIESQDGDDFIESSSEEYLGESEVKDFGSIT